MSTKSQLLKILNDSTDEYISGQKLATILGISRNAVWKGIEALRNENYQIESKSKVGYRLTKKTDLLIAEDIQVLLDFPCGLTLLNTIDSTNSYALGLAPQDTPYLIVSNQQTNGKGRLDRIFYSPPNTGIYLSYCFKPSATLNSYALITTAAALSVALAIEDVVKISPKIKWVNDIYLNDKKIGGILTEATSNFESGKIDYIVIGIGINCFTDAFPEFSRNIPGSLCIGAPTFKRRQLIASVANHLHRLMENMDSSLIVSEYKARCNTLGKQITIFRDFSNPNEKGIRAKAYDIDENGGLVVEYLDGHKMHQVESITSGEITIR